MPPELLRQVPRRRRVRAQHLDDVLESAHALVVEQRLRIGVVRVRAERELQVRIHRETAQRAGEFADVALGVTRPRRA